MNMAGDGTFVDRIRDRLSDRFGMNDDSECCGVEIEEVSSTDDSGGSAPGNEDE